MNPDAGRSRAIDNRHRGQMAIAVFEITPDDDDLVLDSIAPFRAHDDVCGELLRSMRGNLEGVEGFRAIAGAPLHPSDVLADIANLPATGFEECFGESLANLIRFA